MPRSGPRATALDALLSTRSSREEATHPTGHTRRHGPRRSPPGRHWRVLIAGDTHGNTRWVEHPTEVASMSDCPLIIQVGDFGYFPDHRDGPRFVSAVDQACEAHGVELWRLPADDEARADDVRALVRQATMATSPRLLVHGHWHLGYESELSWIDRAATERSGTLTWDSTRVVGLGCDGDTARGWIVLDLPTLDITWPIADE